MATDQEIRAAGYYNIPQQKYLQNPFVIPTEQDDLTAATGAGIPYTNAFTGGSGDTGAGGRPTFNYNFDDSSKMGRNYQPGGMYERNPLVTGVGQQVIGQDRFGNKTVVPNYGLSDEMNPLQRSYATEVEHPENLSRMQRLQLAARKFKGVGSNYERARSFGQLGEWAKTGYGAVPWLAQGVGAFADMLGLKRTGDKSYGQRWAVDNAGWGQGTQRDQFGLYVGTGLGGSVKERMQAEVDRIENRMKATGKELKYNSTDYNMLKDYKEKLGVIESDEEATGVIQGDKVRKRSRDYWEREKIRKQTGASSYNIHGEAAEELDQKPDTPPKYPPSTWTPAGQTGPDTPGQTQGQKDTAAAQKDDPGLGGHKKGGRVPFFYGGIATAL